MIHIPAHAISQMLSYASMVKLSLAKQFGLNTFQFLSLVLVGSTDGLSIKELKHKLSIPGSTLTFTVDSLEKRKLIKRRRSKEDRRQWLLSLSAEGERLYAEIIKAESETMSPLLNNLSESEKAAFLRIAEEITGS
ncbi:MAG: MarR family transcriptional regulator [Chloroflexi bacterium]|nr:MarR family transcriptional regulator [Chloroflexota bacterium]